MVNRSRDRDGTVEMLTLVTPMRPCTTWWVRMWFAISRLSPKVMAIGKLRQVQFTHWSILGDIPYNGAPQLAERPDRAYLVWSTVWTGRVDPYVEAFARTVALRIKLIWQPSYGFPGTKSVASLARYIMGNATPGEFTYAANADATVRTVASARTIAAAHSALLAVARNGDDADFRVAYDSFLMRCGEDL